METTKGIRHHGIEACDGPPCPFHSPSEHSMLDFPFVLRTDWGVPLIERLCSHGIGHPDPDCLDWLENNGHKGFGIHGCDGCCA